ncbi:aldo/keto reductase [Halobacterium litoreum]|uniref:Aldo/keto reductase n=1 Tax=Halobacterium litoreum TaxID=2039234 RepID=A0ABD5NHU9_9EURY|nr:aldo/keto reductase [Halobacterium litoreum]UHH12580.1 aldo/keto reductase [Halobacterium litoreum]
MSQDSQRRTPLADGMPMFGLGTWQNEDADQCAESVRTAVDMGYRHVDTAQAYRNEDAVGRGLADADVDREDVFLATKVWTDNLAPADVHSSTADSLDRLGVDYVDLLYVHWPANEYQAEETLPAFAELKSEGAIKRIGVSNFEPRHLDEARDVLGELPFANQVEFHPLLQQTELREYAGNEDIELVAYSPLARGKVFDVPEIQDVAEKHDASEAQVSLAWVREKGVTAIPKATSEAHIADNWASLDLELDDEDVAKIDAIDRTERQVDPDFGPWN